MKTILALVVILLTITGPTFAANPTLDGAETQKPASECVKLVSKKIDGKPWVLKNGDTVDAIVGTGWSNAMHSCIVSVLHIDKLEGFADARGYRYVVQTIPQGVQIIEYIGMVVTMADGKKNVVGSVCKLGPDLPKVEGCTMEQAATKAHSYFSNYLTLGGTPGG